MIQIGTHPFPPRQRPISVVSGLAGCGFIPQTFQSSIASPDSKITDIAVKVFIK